MTLEHLEYEKQGVVKSRLVDCPLCGHEFGDREPRWEHFFEDHTPEDAGLPPLGTVADESASPLWSDRADLPEEPAD